MRFFRPLRLISARTFVSRSVAGSRDAGVAWQKRRDLATEAIPWNGFVTVRAEVMARDVPRTEALAKATADAITVSLIHGPQREPDIVSGTRRPPRGRNPRFRFRSAIRSAYSRLRFVRRRRYRITITLRKTIRCLRSWIRAGARTIVRSKFEFEWSVVRVEISSIVPPRKRQKKHDRSVEIGASGI